jgi:hypothetical protein
LIVLTEKHEYDVLRLDSDVNVYTSQPPNELFNDRKLLEVPVYKLVSNIPKPSVDHHTIKILSADDKFMMLIDDMFGSFKKGYDILMDLRKSN